MLLNNQIVISLIGVFLIGGLIQAQEGVGPADQPQKLFSVTVDSGPAERSICIVKTLVPMEKLVAGRITAVDSQDKHSPCQISAPGIEFDEAPARKLLTFVVYELKANEKRSFDFFPATGNTASPEFKWHDDLSTQAELQYGDKGVLKYMYEALDDASDHRRSDTCKVYHHVFSPDGNQLVTKGPGGLYPHHRGIFYGFNRIEYADLKADTWHCQNGESQVHAQAVVKIGGPVFGRDINLIMWNGRDGKPFAKEFRQLTAYKIGQATLIEFHSILETLDGDITLDGDPQHAGVQFRASQHVADVTKNKTFYIRPDGTDQPGSYRNWSETANETELNKAHQNLRWNAISFFVDDQQFTCCYLDHPENPKPAMFSERDYGRFGSYFKHQLTSKKPLAVQYRFWLQEGKMSVAEIDGLNRCLVTPITVSID